jgi:hypothetical protein
MKRILSILAVVALVAMAVQAVEVKSENVAGVISVTVGASEYKLVGVTLDDMDSLNPTLADVLGTDGVPDGTVVYFFNGTGYEGHTYYADEPSGWFTDDDELSTVEIDRVTGFWVYAPSSHTFTLTGEVPDYDTPVMLDSGYQIANYPFPAPVALADSAIGQNANDGDVIYVLEGGDYVGHTYYADEPSGWFLDDDSESPLVFNPGDSFWYYRTGSGASYNETVPYSL